MPGILIRWLTTTAAIVATAYLLKGIQVSGFFYSRFCCRYAGNPERLFPTDCAAAYPPN